MNTSCAKFPPCCYHSCYLKESAANISKHILEMNYLTSDHQKPGREMGNDGEAATAGNITHNRARFQRPGCHPGNSCRGNVALLMCRRSISVGKGNLSTFVQQCDVISDSSFIKVLQSKMTQDVTI